MKKIALLAHVDLELVRKSVQTLCYYGTVTLIDIFKFSNCYICTEKIRLLRHDPELLKRCLSYIRVGRKVVMY